MHIEADPSSATMMTTNAPDDNAVQVQFRFPAGTVVIPGRGRFTDEYWMLVGPEFTEDWNYCTLLVSDDYFGGWVIRVTVPWWGPYNPPA